MKRRNYCRTGPPSRSLPFVASKRGLTCYIPAPPAAPDDEDGNSARRRPTSTHLPPTRRPIIWVVRFQSAVIASSRTKGSAC